MLATYGSTWVDSYNEQEGGNKNVEVIVIQGKGLQGNIWEDVGRCPQLLVERSEKEDGKALRRSPPLPPAT